LKKRLAASAHILTPLRYRNGFGIQEVTLAAPLITIAGCV
jgi:hypothetical protein